MSEGLSRTSSSSLSVLLNHDDDSSTESEAAPYVVSSSSKPHGQQYRSTRPARASSVVSLSSSSLTDPDELEQMQRSALVAASTSAKRSSLSSGKITTANKKKQKRASAGASSTAASVTSHAPTSESEQDDAEEDDDEDAILEVNQDGTEKPLTRIKHLLNNPPREPKHNWATAYVYAFIERFTSIQKDHAHAPQTIFEFEQALQEGRGEQMPENAEDPWIPSLEPIFKDFIERVKNADIAAGGSGGIRGGWLTWVPWWVNEQRLLRSPDFSSLSWDRAIQQMKEKDNKEAIYQLDWEKKVTILKALVDYQICLCEEIKTYINDCYGYVSTYKAQGRTKDDKESRAKDKVAETGKVESVKLELVKSEAGAPVKDAPKATTSAAATASTKDKGKEKEKEKAVVEIVNPLALDPIGTDTLRQIWYRVDDSPRLYVNSDPYRGKGLAFAAVSDTPEEISELLTGLHKPPTKSAEPLSGPFAKAADGKRKKIKEKKKKGKALLIENEEKLHAYIRDVVLPSLIPEESSPYYERKQKFENRRSNMIKRIQNKTRWETQAAQREADAAYANLRSSTRLRRGARNSINNYDERARDLEIEAAIRESERDAHRKRRKLGESESDEEYYDGNMDLDEDDDDDENNDGTDGRSGGDHSGDDDDDEGRTRRRARSGKSGRRSSNGNGNSSRHAIPGERRSARQQLAAQHTRRSPTPPRQEESSRRASDSRKASVVRSYSSDLDDEEEQEAPFGGLEEVWSKGQYKGYYRPDRTFIKAQKGDIPLYKLVKMGLPLPPLDGPLPGPSSPSLDANANGSGASLNKPATNGRSNGATASGSANRSTGNTTAELEDTSIPGSAVPTLLGETDDSNMIAGDDDDNDSDGSSAVVVVRSSKASVLPAATIRPNSNGDKDAKGASTPSSKPSSKAATNTSHIQVIV